MALVGREVAATTRYTQVYQATHEGEQRLTFMKRSFISFSFGGKFIEDFNLIATINNNSLDKPGYASFEDNTTTYSNLDGQAYWATHYRNNELNFTLATDGIDQVMLENFLHLFQAGNTQELILAEHPNRAILARVQSPPQLDLLPFEQKIKVNISGYEYETSTTLYKGGISLILTMDSPFWYAKTNILGTKVTNNGITYYENTWEDRPGHTVDIFSSPDALKIYYEDGIPLGSMIQTNMILGNGSYANVQRDVHTIIWDPDWETDIPNINDLPGGGACIEGTVDNVSYLGKIAGAFVNADNEGITELPKDTKAYFYYSGTAPAPTIISFTLTPTEQNGYIAAPSNKHIQNDNGDAYDTITVVSAREQQLKITTPNIYTSFNKAIEIFKNWVTGGSSKSWEDIRKLIREDVRHIKVREWAVKVINEVQYENVQSEVDGQIVTTQVEREMHTSLVDGYDGFQGIIPRMWEFLTDSNGNLYSASFIFNSETGEATGIFSYRAIEDGAVTYVEDVKEDVGDMLRSNYLILRDRNYPTENGIISGWTEENKQSSHYLQHNMRIILYKFLLLYKNMYL